MTSTLSLQFLAQLSAERILNCTAEGMVIALLACAGVICAVSDHAIRRPQVTCDGVSLPQADDKTQGKKSLEKDVAAAAAHDHGAACGPPV